MGNQSYFFRRPLTGPTAPLPLTAGLPKINGPSAGGELRPLGLLCSLGRHRHKPTIQCIAACPKTPIWVSRTNAKAARGGRTTYCLEAPGRELARWARPQVRSLEALWRSHSRRPKS
jgi:hypothetical protein